MVMRGTKRRNFLCISKAPQVFVGFSDLGDSQQIISRFSKQGPAWTWPGFEKLLWSEVSLEPGQKYAVDGSEIYLFLCLRTKSLLTIRVGRGFPIQSPTGPKCLLFAVKLTEF